LQTTTGNKNYFRVGDIWSIAGADLEVKGNIHARNLDKDTASPRYKIRFYAKDNRCLDGGAAWGNKDWLGRWDCQDGNAMQEWYFNPVTGYLKNVGSGKCLDTFDGNWGFTNCNGHQNQRFWRKENLLQSRNGDCLDTGSEKHHHGCDGNNANQTLVFDLAK